MNIYCYIFLGTILGIGLVLYLYMTFMMIKFGLENLAQWQSNNSKPVLSVDVQVLKIRIENRGSVSSWSGHYTESFYYCTFKDKRGYRYSYQISKYSQLTEGDLGMLTYQGSRYHGFQKHGT
jgi:Protein of unknown function (DUF2500)